MSGMTPPDFARARGHGKSQILIQMSVDSANAGVKAFEPTLAFPRSEVQQRNIRLGEALKSDIRERRPKLANRLGVYAGLLADSGEDPSRVH